MNNFDFINRKTVFRYLLYIIICLILGKYLKDILSITLCLAILFYGLNRKLFEALEVFLIWFFIKGFFEGQGYLTIDFISKYFTKPSFLLLFLFITFFDSFGLYIKNAKFISFWILLVILVLLSSIYHQQSIFVVISLSSFYLIFCILQSNLLNKKNLYDLLNLFVSISILQSIISLLQVFQFISPSQTTMKNMEGKNFIWEASLDDVASGTFGAASSHLTSCFVILIIFLLLFTWLKQKNNKYLIYIFISLIQLTIVDSKTVTICFFIVTCILFIRLFKKLNHFNIIFSKYVLRIVLFITIGIIFISLWNSYYQYTSTKSQESRNGILMVYKNEGKESIENVSNFFSSWGKISGFKYVIEDFIKSDKMCLIFGYGIQGYDNKIYKILEKDTEIMQLNNLTNSNSGLISLLATNGILGFIFITLGFTAWYKYNITIITSGIELIKNSLLSYYALFVFLIAFLYPLDLSSIPIISFSCLISIMVRLSKINRIKSNQTLIKT